MDVALTEEQDLLRKTAGQLAERIGTSAPAELEQADDDGWSHVVRAGWPAFRVPEEAGGVGASGVEVAIVCEALGRGLARAPFLGSAVLATELLAAVERPTAAAEALLAGLAAGEKRVAVALDPTLRRPGSGGLAWDAAGAARVLVLDGDRLGVRALVEEHERGRRGADLTRALAPIFPGASGDVDELGTVGRDGLARWEALALSAICADLVGVMDGALASAVAYAKERVQFERPIGSFQAVQHLLADALVSLEASRSCTWYAAWGVDALAPPEALLAARTAKAYCSRAGREVTETVIQVFGGIGITWEAVPHLFLRRALLDRQTLGDEHVQLAEIATARLAAAS